MAERNKYIGAVDDQSDCDDGERVAQMRYELDNRQMQLDGEHTTCVELSRQVYDLEEELAQARKWSSVWKEWAKWAFHYWRHNSACASFAEEEAV